MTTLLDQHTTQRRGRLAAFQTRYASRQWGWGRTCAGCGKPVWLRLYYCPAPRLMAVLPRLWKCRACYLHGGHDR